MNIFLSTPSARRATLAARTRMLKSKAISIHALREEGDQQGRGHFPVRRISIHALREEGDSGRWHSVISPFTYFYPRPPRGGRLFLRCSTASILQISIHALREEGDVDAAERIQRLQRFLSTPSARRATTLSQALIAASEISIHALREEGDVCYFCYVFRLSISIHALREEGDNGSTLSIPCW